MRHGDEQMRALRSRARPLTALLLSAALGGCGNVTAGGVTGEAEVYMSGDAERGGTSTAAILSSPKGGGPSAPGASTAGVIVGAGLEGDVQVTASLYLRRAGAPLIDLTPAGAVTVTLDPGGAQEPLVADEVVPGGSYQGIRIIFTDVVAEVTGGLEIGGVPFTGAVRVDLAGDGLVVDRTLAITVGDDQPVALLVDLGSDVWLNLLNPLSRTVAAADFANAVEVTLR